MENEEFPSNKINNALRNQYSVVNIFGQKRSLCINIFLNQFKNGENHVLHAIENGQGLNEHEIVMLQQILPAKCEIDAIKTQYKYTRALGRDEYFFLKLSEILEYELKIDLLLQKETYFLQTKNFSITLDKIFKCCQLLTENEDLSYFLSIILYVWEHIIPGNKMISSESCRLDDIPYLLDVKPKDTDVPSYFHALVEVAEQRNIHIMDFRKKATRFRKLSRITIEFLEDKINPLCSNIRSIAKRVTDADASVFIKFQDFIGKAVNTATEIQEKLTEVKKVSESVAVHFSQDPETFQLHECFKIFSNLFEKVNKVLLENESRKESNNLLELKNNHTSAEVRKQQVDVKAKSVHSTTRIKSVINCHQNVNVKKRKIKKKNS